MKTQRQSPCLALRLSAMEAILWCLLGFQVEDDFQDQHGASAKQISQIDYAADCAGSLDLTCMKCNKRVSVAQHIHNLSPFSLHCMIEVSSKALACYSISCHALAVSAEAWHLLSLGMLFYIL